MKHTHDASDVFSSALESGDSSFLKYQGPGELRAPFNPLTKTVYPPCCQMVLMLKERSDPRWLTTSQLFAMGQVINPGSKSTLLHFYSSQTVEVYNAADVTGMKKYKNSRIDDKQVMTRAQKMIDHSQAAVIHTNRLADCGYSPADNAVYLPKKDLYPDPAAYYAMAIHQLALASGHPERLGRVSFKEYDKVKEELYATVACYLLAAETGMSYHPVSDPGYVDRWKKILQQHPGEFYKAVSLGSQIKDYLVSGREKCRGLQPLKRFSRRTNWSLAGMEL